MKLILTIRQAPLGSHQMIGKEFSFDENGCRFGRSTDNDLVLPDPNRYVSSRHGLVTYDEGVFLIYDQSSNGIIVDDANRSLGSGRPYALRNGNRLKVGEYVIEVGVEAGELAAAGDGEEGSASAPGASGGDLKASPTGTESAGAGSVEEDIALELALRLGLHGMSEDKLRRMPESVTEILRSCITGIMDVLSSRRQVKSQLKMDMTVIQGARNNALKFSASADEAIERMFTKSDEEYLPPEAALLEAYHDISDHQIAMMRATIEVYLSVVERFDPEILEQKLSEDGKSRGFFSGEPRFWEEYKKQYRNIASGGYPSIHDDFLKEFSTAYSGHLLKLQQERERA